MLRPWPDSPEQVVAVAASWGVFLRAWNVEGWAFGDFLLTDRGPQIRVCKKVLCMRVQNVLYNYHSMNGGNS